MLKRIILFFASVALHSLLIGQTISWSDPSVLDGGNVSQIFSASDSSIYVIKQHMDKPVEIGLDIFDYDLSVKHTATVSFDVDEINHLAFFNDALNVFGTKHLGKEDELIVHQLDTLGKIVLTKSLLKCKANGGYHSYFDVSVSDKMEFCSVIGSDGYTPDQKEIIHSILFDKDWQEVHNEEFVTSILSQKRSYNAITVNDEGVTFVMKRERKKSADEYYLYCISKLGSETHQSLHLKSRNIMDMRYEVDSLGDLYLAGFYSPPYKNMFEGMYIKKFDHNGMELFSKEYMFNENVITSFNSKKEIKEFGYGLRKFHTSHFAFVNEKNMILEAEHITKHKNKSGDMTHIQDGFVLINFSEKGGFQYSTPVRTQQTDEDHGGYWSSHYHVTFDEKDYIFINVLGDGTKGIKEDLPANALFHTYRITMTKNGIAKKELQSFDVSIQNYALYPDTKNKSRQPLLVVKSKEKDQYAIGMLMEEE